MTILTHSVETPVELNLPDSLPPCTITREKLVSLVEDILCKYPPVADVASELWDIAHTVDSVVQGTYTFENSCCLVGWFTKQHGSRLGSSYNLTNTLSCISGRFEVELRDILALPSEGICLNKVMVI